MTLNHNIFTSKVRSMQPYHVPSCGGMIKLDAMESPYGLPADMREALGNVLALATLNRYPNPHSTSTVAKIKQVFALPASCEVILGNGSDELIQIILTAVAKPGTSVLSPTPSFVMYQQAAELLGMNFVGVDLHADFSIDAQAFLQAIKDHQPAVIFLAYPNNPTGMLLDKDFIREVIAAAPGMVVIDEAYSAYADDSAQDLLASDDKVVLIRTLSKIGMAGIRLGYLVAQPETVAQFEKVRMPYNINRLTQAAARFMLEQKSYLDECVDKILREKAALYQYLSAREGVTVFASQTNFLLIRVDDANAVFERLRDEHSILIKNMHGYHPILDNVLRITVGRKKENAKLCQALSTILG